jgi:hypothetical protein
MIPLITSPTTPFVIEHLRHYDRPRSDRYTPEARLLLTPALRTSGLLAALPDAEAKSLLWLLTYLRPDGRVEASVAELMAAMNTGEGKVRARMDRLAQVRWLGDPLAASVKRDNGLDCYVLAVHLVSERQVQQPSPEPEPPRSVPAGREAIVAHSRAAYARPRAEVERMILEQLGHQPRAADTDTGPNAETRRQLLALGVLREQADLLLMNYPLERIERQIAWLPYRHAKNPARLLIAAIEHDYEPPAYVRLQEVVAADAAAAAAERAAGEEDAGMSVPEDSGLFAPTPTEHTSSSLYVAPETTESPQSTESPESPPHEIT